MIIDLENSYLNTSSLNCNRLRGLHLLTDFTGSSLEWVGYQHEVFPSAGSPLVPCTPGSLSVCRSLTLLGLFYCWLPYTQSQGSFLSKILMALSFPLPPLQSWRKPIRNMIGYLTLSFYFLLSFIMWFKNQNRNKQNGVEESVGLGESGGRNF